MYNNVRLLDYPSPANVRRMDMGIIPMLCDMHRNGILVDTAHFDSLTAELRSRKEEVNSDIKFLAGRPLNPLSGDQVAALLFDEMGIHKGESHSPKLVPSKTRFTTQDDTLTVYKHKHPLVGLILEYRGLDKLEGTYTSKLPGMAGADGRVHTTFRNTTTATGRLSSENPNLQNIPIRGEWGKRIRNGFIAPPGWVLVSNDLSQIEMVIIADCSQDPRLLQVFRDELDIHVATASAIFGIPAEQVDSHKHRLPCKTLNYAVVYGVTPAGLQLQILAAGGPYWTIEECTRYIAKWFKEVYPEVANLLQTQYSRAWRYGAVWDMFGRHCFIPEVRSVHRHIQEAGLRRAGNQPIQGGAQGVLRLAMAELRDILNRSYRGVVRPLLQIHDELLCEAREDVAEEWSSTSQRVMENALRLSIPVRSSKDWGLRWGDLK